MNRLLAVAALIVAAPAFAQDPAKAAKDLEGKYAIKEANFDGKPAPAELLAEVKGVEIKDGVITVRTAKRDDPAKFTVVPPKDAKTPGTIDLTAEGDKKKPGLYLFDKEKGVLTIVFSDTGTAPKDLSAGSGFRRLVLVREEAKKEPAKDK